MVLTNQNTRVHAKIGGSPRENRANTLRPSPSISPAFRRSALTDRSGGRVQLETTCATE